MTKEIAPLFAKRALVLAILAGMLPASAKDFPLEPFISVVGGMGYETVQGLPGEDREDRGYTVALSRLGLRGWLHKNVYIESEFEVNAGPHGTSVWEGQAALQVRNQLVRVLAGPVTIDAGRITDISSLDFFSMHVLDQLLTDPYTRNPLLAGGFNRGLGLLARWEVIDGLHLGFTLNWANPTSTTASLVVGGTYPPFSRFYFAAHQQVGRDASGFPADQYDIIVLSPSLTYSHRYVDARAAVQIFRVDTNRNSSEDQPIDGYNWRFGVKGKLLNESLRLFANVSRVQNEVVNPDDGTRLSGELFNGMTVSGGIDWDYFEKNGIGAQYAMIRDQQGLSTLTTQHFINVGTTWWITDNTAVGARASFLVRCEEPDPDTTCKDASGFRTYFTTLRAVF